MAQISISKQFHAEWHFVCPNPFIIADLKLISICEVLFAAARPIIPSVCRAGAVPVFRVTPAVPLAGL